MYCVSTHLNKLSKNKNVDQNNKKQVDSDPTKLKRMEKL